MTEYWWVMIREPGEWVLAAGPYVWWDDAERARLCIGRERDRATMLTGGY